MTRLDTLLEEALGRIPEADARLEMQPLVWARFRHRVQADFGMDPGLDADGPRAPETWTRRTLEAVLSRDDWAYEVYRDDALTLARGDFFMRLWRPIASTVMRLLLRGALSLRVHGRRSIPARNFVLVANHAGHPDAVVLMASVPLRRVNRTHPLAAKDYFWKRRGTGPLVHAMLNALPFDRGAGMEAMKAGLDLLADDRSVILFPEGTRSTTGSMGPFKQGVGLLLAGTDVPAVPAYIRGSDAVLPKGASRPRRAPVSVWIGEPVTYATVSADPDGWRQVAADLEQRVRALGRDAGGRP